MSSFTLPCPSCEAKVVIKNPNLVGTKVECPKCKYRFKVEAPKEEAAKDETKPGKEKKPAATAAADAAGKKPAGKKNKKMMAAVFGGVAVILLAVGAIVIFGGDSKPTSPGGKGGTYAGGGGGGPGGGTGSDATDGKDKSNDPTPPKPVSTVPRSDKDPTNLLPNQAVAVYRLDIKKLRQTPLGLPLFDQAMIDLFDKSMGFDPNNVEVYFHCSVGEKERAPFGVIRLEVPLEPKTIKIAGAGPAKPINGKSLLPVTGNPFLAAVGHAFAARSLLADLYETQPSAAAGGKVKDKSLGVCIYDTQHILVGDLSVLEKYLNGLKDGYPEFLTVLRKDAPPPPVANPMTPMPGAPMSPGMPPVTPKGPTPPAGPTPPPAAKDYTSNPSYLSIPPELKKMLNALDDVPSGPPLVLFAEKFDNGQYSRKDVKKAYDSIVKAIDPVLKQVQYLGLNLGGFSHQRFVATVRIVGKSGEEARQLALEHLAPALTEAVPVLALLLDAQIDLRNYADPNQKLPGGETPGYPMFPMAGMGQPMGFVPTPVGPSLGTGGSAGGPPKPSGPPMGGPPPGSPLGGPGKPGGPPPSSYGGPPPGSPFERGGFPPGYPMPGMGPMGEGSPPSHHPNQTPSHIDLRLTDQVVMLTFEINWSEDVFGRVVYPRMLGIMNQVKGKTTVFAGSSSWSSLAEAVKSYVKQNNRFPSGTVARPPNDPSRLGLSYPPIQRMSFFAELLPYLGRSVTGNQFNGAFAWYYTDNNVHNAEAAGAWVPELLVPYYPPSSWRATSTLAPEYMFGGTNYVAIAGVGLDAARYNPANKDQQKLMGISGYDWSSKVEEVTDGLANTIYLMQVPPSSPRPWAAGGGATVVGINPADPMADFKHQRPDGQWGTHAIMGDGEVRWIPADIKPADLLALVTRAGGEKLSGDLDKIVPRVDSAGKVVELKAVTKEAPPKTDDASKDAGKAETAPPPKGKN